ncbi:aldehyde dehydrogenase family protein [Streptomyces sviceus]
MEGTSRVGVHRSVAEEFGWRLAERMGALVVGPGTRDGVDVGPLIDRTGRAKVDALVADAVERGARVLVGGRTPEGPGCFYPPTAPTEVSPESRLVDTEIFGPVAAILTFDDEDEVVRRANDTPWGLVGYVFTEGLDRALLGLDTGQAGRDRRVPGVPVPVGAVR